MRRKPILAKAVARVAAGVVTMASAMSPVSAATYYWDTNSTTAGSGNSGGIWDAATANWTTDSTGAATTVAWVNDGSATPNFSAGTNATGTFTVTLSGALSISGLATDEGTITLTGGSLSTTNSSFAIGATTTINTPLDFSGAGSTINKTGAGTLILNAATGINTATLTGGVLQFGGSTTLPGVSTYTVPTTTALVIDNGVAANSNRLADTATLTLTGGSNFAFNGNATTSVSEVTGAITISNDHSLNSSTTANNTTTNFLTMNGGAGGTTMTAASLTVQSGAMVTVRGPGLGTASNRFKLADNGASLMIRGAGSTSGTTKSIVNGVLGDTAANGTGSDFITYDATNGFVVLGASDYATSITSGDASKQNVSLSAASTVTSNTTINSLKTNTGASVAINPGSTLALSSGMMLLTAPTTISGGKISVPTDTELMTVVRQNSTISSVIDGSSLFVKDGTGTLTLTGNNTYTAPTTVSAGTLAITSNNALGDTAAGTSVARGASLQLSNNITVPESITIAGSSPGVIRGTLTVPTTIEQLNQPTGWVGGLDNASGNNTITGNITLTGNIGNVGNSNLNTISVSSGTLTIAGQVVGGTTGNSLAKTGPGTLVLTQPSTYDTLTRLWGGTLVVQADNALGTNSSLGVFQLAGSDSTFALQAPAGSPGFTFSSLPLSLPGWGHGTQGALDNFGGDNTITGQVTFGVGINTPQANTGDFSQTYIGVTAGSLTLTQQLTLGTSTSASRAIQKNGTGNLILSGGLHIHGPVDIAAGSITFADGGVLSADNIGVITPVRVENGASLVFDNTNNYYSLPGNGTNQSPIQTGAGNVAAYVQLFSGELKLIGHTPSGFSTYMNYALGDPTLQQTTYGKLSAFGTPIFTVVTHGEDTTLVTPDRVNRDTFFIRGMGDSFAHVMVGTTTSASLVGGSGSGPATSILPYAIGAASATGAPTDFVTLDSATGFYRTLDDATEYTALADGTNAAVNTKASGSVSINSPTSVNALKLTGGSVAVGGGNTLSVATGLLATGGSTSQVNGGTLSFGASEGFLYAAAGSTLAVSSTLSGSNGVTVGGNGTVTLSGNNTFTGGLQMDGGTLVAGSDNNLGAADGLVTLTGGIFSPAATLTSSARPFQIAGRPAINVADTQSLTLSGNITDVTGTSGLLTKSGAGTLVLTGNNTYSGGTTILGGILSVNSAAALARPTSNGYAPITIDGGTLQFTGGGTIDLTTGFTTPSTARGIQLGQNNGTIDVTTGTTVLWDTSTNAFPMYGQGSLTKTGGGTFVFQGNTASYNGGTYINGGTLQYNVAGTFPSSAGYQFVKIGDTGRILLNNITMNYDLFLNGEGATLAGMGSATFNQAQSPKIADGVNVNFEAVSSADTLTIGSVMSRTGTGTTPTINVTGGGTVFISATQSSSFAAKYLVKNGATLRLGDNTTPLGSNTNSITVDTTGGTISSRTSASRNYSNPVTLNGDSTFNFLTTTTAGAAGNTVTFGALSINGDRAVNMTFPATGSNGVTTGTASYVFGATTLAGSPTFTINKPAVNGSNTPIGNMTLGAITESGGSRSITKAGSGNLTLAGSGGGITGTVNLNAGGLIVTGTPSVGRIVQAAGSALTVNGTSAKLTLRAGGATADLLTTVPTFTGTAAELDIKNNTLAIDYTGATVTSALRSALAGGSHFTGTTAAWNGQGIVSSSTGDSLHGIGYLEAADYLGLSGSATATWNGVTVDATSLLATITYYGDINLDTTVSRDDLALLDRGNARYAAGAIAAGQATWLDGDANYDGAIDVNDYLLTDISYVASGNPLSPDFLAEREAQFGPEYVSQLTAAVPEPASLGIIGLVGAASLARRRRTNRQS